MNHILQIANLITEDPDLLLEINPDFTEEPDENGDMNVDKALAHRAKLEPEPPKIIKTPEQQAIDRYKNLRKMGMRHLRARKIASKLLNEPSRPEEAMQRLLNSRNKKRKRLN